MHFISIVGTQVMAVINPVLALKEADHPIEKIHLLATGYTRGKADQLRDFFVKQGFDMEAVCVHEISGGMQPDNKGRPAAHDMLKQLRGEAGETTLNVAGGLNFQVAACVGAIPTDRVVFTYPENNGVHLFRCTEGTLTDRSILPLPPALDVLSLQGITTQTEKVPTHNKVKWVLKQLGLDKRKDLKTGVRIGGMLFDAIWNAGNVLYFLKLLVEPTGTTWKPEKWLEEARKIEELAIQRVPLAELHHREIILLCHRLAVIRRVNVESQGKVKAFKTPSDRPIDQQLFMIEMRKTLQGLVQESTYPKPDFFPTEAEGSFDNGITLLAVLARDVAPTLNALWSHRPEHACLFYTPGDENIERMYKAFKEYSRLLPCRNVTFMPMDLLGYALMDIARPDQNRIEVNITPGSKAHAAILALWAGKHGVPYYSIDTGRQLISRLSRPESKQDEFPLVGPNPYTVLALSGHKPQESFTTMHQLQNQNALFDALLHFLTSLSRKPQILKGFPNNRIEMQGMIYKPKGRIGQLITPEKGFSVSWPINDGKWIESLLGYAVGKCGADDVCVGLKTDWDETSREVFERRHGASGHMTDIDVAVRLQARYYAISCKQSMTNTETAAREINAMAALFGRFTYPMLFQLKYTGEPARISKGVWRFGVKTLTDQKALRDFLDMVARSKSTT